MRLLLLYLLSSLTLLTAADPSGWEHLGRFGEDRLRHGRADRVQFSPDGSVLYSYGTDRYVFEWDPATGEALRRCGGIGWTVRGMVFNQNGDLIFGTGFNGEGSELLRVSAQSLQVVERVTGIGDWVEGTCVGRDGAIYAYGVNENRLVRWHNGGIERLNVTLATWGTITPGAGTDELFISDDNGLRRITLIDPAAEEQLLPGPFHRMTALSDNQVLLASPGKNHIELYQHGSGQSHWADDLPASVHDVVVSADGSQVLVLLSGAVAELRNSEGTFIRRFPVEPCGAAFSPDNQTLATIVYGRIQLWDVASGEELAHSADTHGDGNIDALTVVPGAEGPLVVSGHPGGLLNFYDSGTLQTVGHLDLDLEYISEIWRQGDTLGVRRGLRIEWIDPLAIEVVESWPGRTDGGGHRLHGGTRIHQSLAWYDRASKSDVLRLINAGQTGDQQIPRFKDVGDGDRSSRHLYPEAAVRSDDGRGSFFTARARSGEGLSMIRLGDDGQILAEYPLAIDEEFPGIFRASAYCAKRKLLYLTVFHYPVVAGSQLRLSIFAFQIPQGADAPDAGSVLHPVSVHNQDPYFSAFTIDPEQGLWAYLVHEGDHQLKELVLGTLSEDGALREHQRLPWEYSAYNLAFLPDGRGLLAGQDNGQLALIANPKDWGELGRPGAIAQLVQWPNPQ